MDNRFASLFYFMFVAILACSPIPKKEATKTNDFSELSNNAEWIDLTNASAWRGYNMDTLPGNWSIAEGVIKCYGEAGDQGGDIITLDKFDNFELVLEWKLSKGGNSGVFYHVIEDPVYHSPYQTGQEIQVIDDFEFPEPLQDWQKTGADYNMYPPKPVKKLKPSGEWNHYRIVFNNRQVEYWLNGDKIVEYTAWTPDWYKRKAASKWAAMPHWGVSGTGHIGLQDHGAGVWFKNIKVRKL